MRPGAEIRVGGVWTDITDHLSSDEPIRVDRGRADEQASAAPSSLQLSLRNSDGAFSPGNPLSPYYPDWGRGCEIRVSVDGGYPAARLPGTVGSNVTTPHVAALGITGTISVAVKIDPDRWSTELSYSQGGVSGGAFQDVISKWSPSNLSWRLFLEGPGWAYWEWSANGTSSAGLRRSSYLWSALAPRWIGVTFAANNGAGGNTITWYTSEDGSTWTQVATETQSGTSTINAGTAPVELGSSAGGTSSYHLEGRFLEARIRSGSITAGTVVAAPVFTALPLTTRSFTDSAGRVWTVNGDASVDNRTVRAYGQVDEITVGWPYSTPRTDPVEDGVSHVSVVASGSLRRLTQGAEALQSTLRRKLTSESVAELIHAYWPMEDGRSARQFANLVPGGAPLVISGDFTPASDSTLPASEPLVSISSGKAAYLQAPVPQTIDQVPGVRWEVTRFFRIDTPVNNPLSTQILSVDTNGRVETWFISINNVGVFVAGRDPDGGSVVSTNFAAPANFFNTWCQVLLMVEDNGVSVAWQVRIIPIPEGNVYGVNGLFNGDTGVPSAVRNLLIGPPSGVSFGHTIVTSGADIGWLAGADTAWVDETAAHRFWRLCAEEGVGANVIGDPTVHTLFRGDPAISPPMGPQGQAPLVDLLSECVAVDQGVMFEHRTSSTLDFRLARTMVNQPNRLTMDTRLRAVSRGFEAVLDDQRLRNDVTVSRRDGSEARVLSDPPPANGERYDDSLDVNVSADPQLPDQAGWRVHLGSWPGQRYPQVGLPVHSADPSVAAQWVDTALGDRVLLDWLPRQHEQSVAMILEGYTESITGNVWLVDPVNGSPAGPWDVAVRDDTARARRDTAGSQLASAVTATATSLSVTTTLGPRWTTVAGDMPFTVIIGGETMTVTAVAGASSPQTFTVVRSTNGVVKAHPSGEAVHVYPLATRSIA